MTACGVSVIVPVHRNGATLTELHRRLDRALADEPEVQLVFVDDACPDGSGDVLAGLARTDPRVQVVRHQSNLGQHRAVLSGLRLAHGEWVVIMDADLQDPPDAVPRLLARGRLGGADVVFGTRTGRYQGLGRTISGRIYRRALAAMLGLPQGAGMFCALEASLARRLIRLRGPEPAIVAMIASASPRMASIPVERARRPVGTSAYAASARARSAWRAFRWAAWARRNHPRTETT